jgi:hypothetical protein
MTIADFRMRIADRLLIAGLLIGIGTVAIGQQPSADSVTVPLSDPSRPAVIDVSLVQGSITVRGTNRKDVLVVARPETDRPSRRGDADATGLRRIPQTAGFRISEEANRVKISSDSPNRSISFEIEAPARANLKLHTVNGGEIVVDNIDGDLDVSNVNGGISLTNVAGSVTAGTTNGSVRATITRVTAERQMAFTSLNGTVDVSRRRRKPTCGCAATTAMSTRTSMCSWRRRRRSFRKIARKAAAATAAIASAATVRSSARLTAADRNSSCAPSTATFTSERAAEGE